MTQSPEIEVIEATLTDQQWVALECALNEGSNPEPDIVWFQRDSGTGDVTALAEDTAENTVLFVDDKRWLILITTSDAITDKEYYCNVTNKNGFQSARGPTVYVLRAGESCERGE